MFPRLAYFLCLCQVPSKFNESSFVATVIYTCLVFGLFGVLALEVLERSSTEIRLVVQVSSMTHSTVEDSATYPFVHIPKTYNPPTFRFKPWQRRLDPENPKKTLAYILTFVNAKWAGVRSPDFACVIHYLPDVSQVLSKLVGALQRNRAHGKQDSKLTDSYTLPSVCNHTWNARFYAYTDTRENNWVDTHTHTLTHVRNRVTA